MTRKQDGGRILFHARTAALLGLAMVAAQALGGSAPQRLRAAVMTPPAARDEFKVALKEAKWKVDGYEDTASERERLAKNVGDYDVVLVGPGGLTGAVPADVPQALRGFMEAGGAVIATGVAASNDVAWLAGLGSSYEVQVKALEKGKGAIRPEGTLLTYPLPVGEAAEPAACGFAFAGQNGQQWEIAGRADNLPCVVIRRFGKGALVLSAARFRNAAFLTNVGKLLELQRMGLAFAGIKQEFMDGSEKVDRIALGCGTVHASFRNTSDTNIAVKVVLEVAGWEASRTFLGTGGQKRGERFDVDVGAKVDLYGTNAVTITVENSATGKSAVLSAFTVSLPEFLEIEPPAYRGMISTARRDASVHFGLVLHPVFENVRGDEISFSVADAKGKELAAGKVVARGAGRIDVSLPLAADAPVGVYTLAAKALRGGAVPASATAAFKVVPVRPGQMFIDQDGVILNEGKPFFPLGLYHAHGWQIDEWLGMGVNMIQCWCWDWDSNYSTNPDVLRIEDVGKRAAKIRENAERQAKLQKAGIRVIYEEGVWDEMINRMGNPPGKDEKYNFETNAVLHAKLESIRDDPSHLVGMWYIADEVSGKGWVPTLQRAKKLFNDLSEDTLTYNLSFGDFSVAPGGDVYAVDVYPRYSGGKGPLTRVSDTMDSSRAGVEYRQPVVAVLEAFGQKTQADESPAGVRAMSYLAVTHGVQGVFWYCWKQTGDWDGKQAQGMGWNPPTAEMVKAVIAEFKVFAPALLEPGARMLKSADGRIHAIICGSEKTGRFLVYVNGEEEPAESTLTVPELANTKLAPLFGGPDGKVRDGKLALKLAPLATGAFQIKSK